MTRHGNLVGEVVVLLIWDVVDSGVKNQPRRVMREVVGKEMSARGMTVVGAEAEMLVLCEDVGDTEMDHDRSMVAVG